jgi:4-hydroxythreonine-4-phosphate dehydrogenase
MHPRIAISIGDYNGIGPEVTIKALHELMEVNKMTPIILGSSKIVNFYLDTLDLDFPYHAITSIQDIFVGEVNVLECLPSEKIDIHMGQIDENAGNMSMLAVETGINLCMEQKADALVTAPISKEAIQKAGYPYPGHTEFLADKTNCKKYMMMMVNDRLRIGLVTIHIPLSHVGEQVTRKAVLGSIQSMHKSLMEDFDIKKPRIAVLGLNPHAGDGGVIGKEEIEIIRPAMNDATQEGIECGGPFPADGFFGNRMYVQYDGVIAMYHDQGLIPFKTLSFNAGVNFTAGLPIIRTSPDHGTAFNISGKNKASHKSLIQAIELARKLSMNRNKEYAS